MNLHHFQFFNVLRDKGHSLIHCDPNPLRPKENLCSSRWSWIAKLIFSPGQCMTNDAAVFSDSVNFTHASLHMPQLSQASFVVCLMRKCILGSLHTLLSSTWCKTSVKSQLTIKWQSFPSHWIQTQDNSYIFLRQICSQATFHVFAIVLRILKHIVDSGCFIFTLHCSGWQFLSPSPKSSLVTNQTLWDPSHHGS